METVFTHNHAAVVLLDTTLIALFVVTGAGLACALSVTALRALRAYHLRRALDGELGNYGDALDALSGWYKKAHP